jgi:hypothetical protein
LPVARHFDEWALKKALRKKQNVVKKEDADDFPFTSL